jgi:hypothetical protein
MTSHCTLGKIEKFEWKVLPHPPYSLDLAPSDYHLFGPLKITGGASMTKTLRQSCKPCIYGSEILKQTSTAALSSSNSDRIACIILGILWNSDRSSSIIQDNFALI